MRDLRLLAALALGLAAMGMAGPAQADDPNDPTMASLSARERDRAIIRKLNRDQLAYVRERDARYAQGWNDYRAEHGDRGEEGGREESESDDAGYASAQREYRAELARWRQDVAACRAGYYERCGD